MVTVYSTVNIYGETGVRVKEFLNKHPNRYKNTVTFIDAAVNEKIDREEQILQTTTTFEE